TRRRADPGTAASGAAARDPRIVTLADRRPRRGARTRVAGGAGLGCPRSSRRHAGDARRSNAPAARQRLGPVGCLGAGGPQWRPGGTPAGRGGEPDAPTVRGPAAPQPGRGGDRDAAAVRELRLVAVGERAVLPPLRHPTGLTPYPT